MFEWPWRYSGADGLLCTNNGCVDDWCMCQSCPICDERKPLLVLTTYAQFTRTGQWIGPHCLLCDMNIYFGRQLSDTSDDEYDE